MYGLRNASNGTLLATHVGRARTAWERGIGLLFRDTMRPDEGLWIDSCSAIHTMMMRFGIDVLFLDTDDRVIHIVNGVQPNRFVVACRDAVSVVELGLGGMDARDILIGDRLVLEGA
jgi:uncharacterized protein